MDEDWDHKRCRACGQVKALEEFPRGGDGIDLRRDECRACYWPRDRSSERAMSKAEYAEMLAAQGGVCAICGGVDGGKRLAVDHDHRSGRVRGLLCDRCNRGLGFFRDDPRLLRRARRYLLARARIATTTATTISE